ncbi:MAG TPA: LptF/LptG family permease [Alphaproteobacteria bacterium]|nr:LptF/LptG family permease [Alphaproteobacteria bacterium]
MSEVVASVADGGVSEKATGRGGAFRMGSGSVFWNYFGRQAALLLAISLGLTIPLVLVHIVPLIEPIFTRGLSPKLLYDAVPLFFPLIFYLATPVFLAITLARFYDGALADNEITALNAAGLSKLSVAKPAIALSLIATGVCVAISVYLIPASLRSLENIRYNARTYIHYRALPEGRFIGVKRGVTIYIYRWVSATEVEDVFLIDKSKPNESRVLFARKGEFVEDPEKLVLILHRGRIDVVSKKTGTAKYDSVSFNRLSQHLPMLRRNIWRVRGWRGPEEQTIAALMDPPTSVLRNPSQSRKWRGELYRRLIAPFLCLSYGIFCVGVLLGMHSPRRDRMKSLIVIAGVVGGLHLTFFLLLQGVVLPGPAILGLFGAILVLPLASGLILLTRTDRRTARLARASAA